MTKEEFIARYGEEAYEKRLQQSRDLKRQKNNSLTKEELIARYGEEAYEKRKKYARDYHRKNDVTKKEDMIAKFGQEWYENRKRRSRELNAERRKVIKPTKEQHERDLKYAKVYSKTYLKDPVNKLRGLLRTRKRSNSIVSSDEAMTLLVKEAEECGCPELLNMDYMVECFHNNCKYGLIYGNLEILKYFYRLMQIKVANNESFTESDKELMHYFRNCKVGKIKPGILQLNNDWVIDIANIDMAYVDDMIRNVRGLDLMMTEEKYNELKGLTTEE